MKDKDVDDGDDDAGEDHAGDPLPHLRAGRPDRRYGPRSSQAVPRRDAPVDRARRLHPGARLA